jgi:hypothetical protein
VSVVDWWQQADNAGLRGTFYQMWYPIPDFDTTPNWVLWKAFITFLRPHHDRVLYDVRAALGGPEVLLAPVADVLVAVYDDRVALGVDFADFWYDALHINELGYYVAALTHWAVMHQQSPVGLPWSFSPAITGLTAPLAAALQAKVWSVVNADAYAKPGAWPSTVIPAAVTSGQWTATAGDTQISVTIGSLPDNGGSVDHRCGIRTERLGNLGFHGRDGELQHHRPDEQHVLRCAHSGEKQRRFRAPQRCEGPDASQFRHCAFCVHQRAMDRHSGRGHDHRRGLRPAVRWW